MVRGSCRGVDSAAGASARGARAFDGVFARPDGVGGGWGCRALGSNPSGLFTDRYALGLACGGTVSSEASSCGTMRYTSPQLRVMMMSPSRAISAA